MPDRDFEKTYPIDQFIAKFRRLADDLENGEQLEIQIANERVNVPVRATYNIEHERTDGHHEIGVPDQVERRLTETPPLHSRPERPGSCR